MAAKKNTIPAKRPRRSDPGRRDRLVDVALDVIAQDGLVRTTCRSVAAAADVPLGSITYHFTSVDELIAEAFEKFVGQCKARFEETMDAIRKPAPELPAALASIVGSYVNSRHDTILAYELYVGAIRSPRLKEVMNHWMRHSRGLLERHMDAPKARIVDAMIEGSILHNYIENEPMSAADLEAAFRKILRN